MASIAGQGRFGKAREVEELASLLKEWPVQEIHAACQSCGHRWRDRFWTPAQTIWTFLLQVLHVGYSCRAAVALSLSRLAAAGRGALPSADPSAYGQARQRLPVEVLRQGVRAVGHRLQERVAATHRWCGRRVWVVDGSSCSMPDTPSLQETFDQPRGQKPGCGFPVAKLVAMFCWASGAVLEVAIGPWWRSELALWRELWHLLRPRDVVLGDRFYCTFADLAALRGRGGDGVFRLHQQRPADLRRGRRLGNGDRLVTWRRPTYNARPRGMSRSQWEALPETLTVRLIRVVVDTPGFRSQRLVVATSLLDPKAYPRDRIAALYGDRWTVELRLRELKTTLGLDVLRGQSPDIVLKEIYMHLLAYNLIRSLMAEAAATHATDLHRLSFAGTLDRLNAALPYLALLGRDGRAQMLYEWVLACIARDPLPSRPERVEPRAVKRRPKPYPLLNKPRHQMRKALVS